MMRRLGALKVDLLLLAAFLILPLLLFADVTIGGRTMVPADNLFQWQPWAEMAGTTAAASAPQNSLLSDLILQNYIWKQFVRESLAQGELPLWNPHLFAGVPFLAAGQHSAYYPFNVIFLLLPLPVAYGWYTVSQLWLAGIFMYLFARVLGLCRSSAAIAGLIYQGSGFMLVSASVFPMIVGSAAWLPLLLAAVEMVVRTSTERRGSGKTLPWVVLGAVALGLQVLAGHVEITYYTLLVMAAYAGWRLLLCLYRNKAGTDSRLHSTLSLVRPAVWLLSLVLLGLMLGAIQLIPLYELVQTNFREGAVTLAEVRSWAFPPRRALTLLLPNFFGNPAHYEYLDLFTGGRVPFTTNSEGVPNPWGAGSSVWGLKNYVEGGIYLGILPLLLAALGLGSLFRASRRRASILFFAMLALLALAFIFGIPIYAVLYYGLPGVNQLHSPFRWVFPFSLAVAALAGYGVDFLLRWHAASREPRRTPAAARWLARLSVAAGLLLLVALLLSRLFYGQVADVVERLFLSLALAPDAFPHARAFYSYQFANLLILGLMLIASGAVLRFSRRSDALGRRWPVWPLLAAGLILLDLLLANWGFHAAVDPALLAQKPPLVVWLEQQPGLWRLTTFDPHREEPFPANAGWLYGFHDVRGYDSIIPRQYTQMMDALEPQNQLLFNRVQPLATEEALQSPLLDLLNVRYIITGETLSLPHFRQVWEGEALRVYENLDVAPRAYTIARAATAAVADPLAAMTEADPRQLLFVEEAQLPAGWGGNAARASQLSAADITGYGNIEVTVEARVDEPSWLVLNDSFFPGWKAFVRPAGATDEAEQEVDIYRVNANFRGVLLEEGSWTVRFRYSPLTFKLGGLASAMAAVSLLFALGVWAWRRLYRPVGELSNTHSIAKNSIVPTALNLLNRFIDFLFAAFYLRILGPADAGSYANAIAVAAWFEILSNFGLNVLVIREVSQDRQSGSRYLLNTIVLRLGITVVAALPIFLYLWLAGLGSNPLGPEAVAAILLLMAGMIFSGVAQSFTGLFYAFETAEVPAAITTLTTILKVGFGVVALLLGFGFVGLAAASILVNIVTLSVLALATFRSFKLRGPWRIDFSLQRHMVGQSYPLMLNHLLATIFFFVDVPLLRQIRGETAVGWYNSAYKWVNALNVIPSFFTFALFPVISRQIENNLAHARRTFRLSVKLMFLLALPVAAFTTLLAPLLIGVLGGAEFLPHGAIALQLVIWSIPIGWINSVTNYVLIALGLERVQVRAFLIGVTFNVAANLLLMPIYGYQAAAVITIFSEMILLITFSVYLRRGMPDVGWVALLWRPALVTAVTGAALWVGAQVHLAAGLSLGMVVYPAGLWVLGVFGEEEKQILRSLLPAPLAARLRLI